VSLIDAKPDPTSKSDDKSASKRRWWKLPAAIALAAFFILLSPLWAVLLFRRMDFFRVRHVEVIGARHIHPPDVLERLQVDTLNSVWDPTEPLEARVSAHPLIREVQIERKLPGTLVVRIIEHIPVALVATTGGFRAYDERGVALPIDPSTSDIDAPILDRPDTLLLRLLGATRRQAPAVYLRLSEIRRGGQRSDELLLVLDSVPVRAGADVTLERLADLELVEQDLARRRLRATELDVRYRDQVIARLSTP
jgi:cell division protein FtsQ